MLSAPSHTHGYRAPFSWWKAIAVLLVGVLVFAGSIFSTVYAQLVSTVNEARVDLIAQKNVKQEIVDPNSGKALNILLLGTDSRDGAENQAIGGSNDVGNHQADTTMVVHISANRQFIDIVSIPRDSIVSVPSCETSNGTIPAQRNIMFNSVFATAYDRGGDLASAASCTVSAVNALTGLNISQFITVDFGGLKNMIDALGGVDVCISQDFSDRDANLTLSRGLNHLNGTDATQFARVRHGLGDGSDIMRTVRQQYLIKMLLREALKQNILTNFDKLFQLSTTALKSLSISSGLADTNILIGLANSLKSFKVASIYSQTVPVETWSQDANRVVWTSGADELWTRIQDDRPLSDDGSDSSSSTSGTTDSSTNTQTNTQTQSQSQSQSQSQQTTTDSSTSSSNSSSTSSSNSSTANASTVDPNTGLITQADGTLIDPKTGGYVDKDSGVIHNPTTGWSIGLADEYLNYTVCGIKS